MPKFDPEKYEQVQDRIPRFLKKYEHGRIITDLMSPVDKLKIVVFKACLYDGETLLATGWAHEIAGEGFVNQTSHLENCETSAIGRALANIGLHGDKRPSREEMEKVERHKQINSPAALEQGSTAQRPEDKFRGKRIPKPKDDPNNPVVTPGGDMDKILNNEYETEATLAVKAMFSDIAHLDKEIADFLKDQGYLGKDKEHFWELEETMAAKVLDLGSGYVIRCKKWIELQKSA